VWIEALIVLLAQAIVAASLLRLRDRFLFQKLLHLSVGVSTLLLHNLLEKEAFVALTLLMILLLILIPSRYFDRKLGVVAFPISVLIVSLLFYENSRVFVLSLSPMFFADPAGALVGRYLGRRAVPCGKTLEGTLAFYLVSFAIFLSGGFPVMDALLVALILSLLEISSPKGLDNITVPLSAMALVGGWGVVDLWMALPISVAVAIPICLFGWLTWCAGIAVASLGTVVLYSGGFMWVIPLVAFVVIASLVGRVLGSGEQMRDVNQVFANGGVSAFLAVLYAVLHEDILYYMHLSAVAAMMADTLATEVGMRFSKRSYLITSLRPVEKGVSGGVSGWGFLGAFLGALLIGVLAGKKMIAVAASGFAGSIVDSYLGALFERRGLWNNDITNFLSASAGALFFVLLSRGGLG